jgi:hypothetical protein
MIDNSYDFFHIKDKKDFAVHLNRRAIFSEPFFNKDTTLMNSYFEKTLNKDIDEKAVTEIINEKFKGLIQIPNSYFHYFSDFVGPVFIFLENCIKNNIKEVELILVEVEGKQETVKEFNNFFKHCLSKFEDRITVSYVTINQNEKNDDVLKAYIRVNNSTTIEQQDIGISLDFIYNSAKSFASLSDNTTPNKKVFLSRKNDIFKDKAEHRHIYEEDAEEFFRSIGFEVVNAESFESLEEQIRFFDKVSVFAGYAGSGLTSSMFMKPGQTVLEIVCPIKFGTCGNDGGDEWEIHNFYKTYSILKNHTYIAVANVNKTKEQLLEELKKVSKML